MALTECDSTSAAENSLANGQNSFNCQEESCNNPFADNYFNLKDIYSLCQEVAENMVFKKGNKIWLNRKHSEESKIKMSESCMGRTSPNKGRKFPPEYGEKISESLKGRLAWNKGKKGIYSEETLRKMADAKKGFCPPTAFRKGDCVGEKNNSWIDGRSFLPYCSKFNKELKEMIRERDNQICQLCGTKENGRKLDVHHVHYDKENCEPDLISLCHICHVKVNHNRDYWENYFMNLIKVRTFH